ncbi:multiple epidermal growth factor-like domains protein 9 [Cynoglossus semilaevis]|uniref:Multiple epidermal growth factor-like domains protein 9 n=1 Tax=Cynoglossus semilaevis TaxID=244447 RepID=A0A3P8VK86_CYNSE|nr:multiple epidermal growth factor-like domains protein 9 [Cynoglossus semilaevis]
MSSTSSMMYISPLLTFILYVYIGFSNAAPRINLYDAPQLSNGKPDPASGTWDTFRTDLPSHLYGRRPPTVGPVAAAFPPTEAETSILLHNPATRESGKRSAADELAAAISKLSSARKRSTDGLPYVEKTLQTTGSRLTQRSDNDAWAAVATPLSGPYVSPPENSQELLCNCSSGNEGISDPNECDQTTGQCECLTGYAGLQCEDCFEGFFTNGTSGCLPCSCDSFGAVDHLCDSSGICVCKMGVYGPKCDECHPGFFHFSTTGCRPCQCNNHTSYCHPQSGVCLNCEGNTQGSNCEVCKPAFYRRHGAAPTDACLPCPCSNSTSSGTCHIDSSGSPVCDQCLHQYSGSQCDKCSAGFHKVSGACVPCDCSGNADPRGPAQICHPDTGHCLQCINNTGGHQCQLCAPGFTGDAKAHNCKWMDPRILPTSAARTTTQSKTSGASSKTSTTLAPSASTLSHNTSVMASTTTTTTTATTTQALLTSLSSPTDNTTAALTEVSWTQFHIIILAVIILVVVVLLGFVGGVYMYREYQNRKLNAPFWTIELKEDNISFSSYHDSIPNADVSGLLEDEATEVAPNGQLALTTQGNCYKA